MILPLFGLDIFVRTRELVLWTPDAVFRRNTLECVGIVKRVGLRSLGWEAFELRKR